MQTVIIQNDIDQFTAIMDIAHKSKENFIKLLQHIELTVVEPELEEEVRNNWTDGMVRDFFHTYYSGRNDHWIIEDMDRCYNDCKSK